MKQKWLFPMFSELVSNETVTFIFSVSLPHQFKLCVVVTYMNRQKGKKKNIGSFSETIGMTSFKPCVVVTSKSSPLLYTSFDGLCFSETIDVTSFQPCYMYGDNL